MASTFGDRDITDAEEKAFGQYFFDQILDYILNNFDIEQLYEEEVLLTHIKDSYSPEDVFTDRQLTDWAERNGWEWRR